jgi:hypothetical protein
MPSFSLLFLSDFFSCGVLKICKVESDKVYGRGEQVRSKDRRRTYEDMQGIHQKL